MLLKEILKIDISFYILVLSTAFPGKQNIQAKKVYRFNFSSHKLENDIFHEKMAFTICN